MTHEKSDAYRAALSEARVQFSKTQSRLAEIAGEQMTLEHDLAKLRRTITALAALCSESPLFDHLGITDACVEVMAFLPTEVTTAQVAVGLELIGFDLSGQKNAHASIHAVLNRLARRGKINKVEGDGDSAVRWRGPKYDPFATPHDDDIPF